MSALTCISCHVAFCAVQSHREHYKSDWHRYNLMRKVADLPPVSSEAFQQRAELHKLKLEENANNAKSNKSCSYCETCHKYFGTANAFTNHVNSKKHLEMDAKSKLRQIQVQNKNLKNLIKNQEAARNDILNHQGATASGSGESAPSKMTSSTLPSEKVVSEDDEDWEDSEGSDWESVDEDDEADMGSPLEDLFDGTPLMENECLFCSAIHSDLAKCVDHMTSAHSFFIPDVEYLTDLSGLINYLGRKIGGGRMCIWCSTPPGLKRYRTVMAVQQHMIDKGHCKMLHEGESLLEYADYYDYSSSYPDQEDPEAEVEIPTLDSDDWQLVLPSGATIGHRSLHRYFKQNVKPIKEEGSGGKQRASIQHLMTQYRALGYKNDTSSKAIKQKAKDLYFVKQMQAKQHLKIGLKNYQAHYRPQVLF